MGALFVISLLTAALLAAEAHRAVTYHRRTAGGQGKRRGLR